MSTATVTSKDRFSFAVFLALSLHALLILGVGFSSDQNMPETISIDVTLSLSNDLIEPEEADFVATTNQQGSGTEAEISEMTTTSDADFDSNQFQTVMSQPLPVPEETAASDPLLTTDAEALDQAAKEELDPTEAIDPIPTNQFDREKVIQEIASLEARIAEDQQALAKMPRTKRINSVSTRSASEAAYLSMWREKCERIGAINYPAGQLEGEVLILVSILSDGTLEEVRILKSSGHRKLDQAALATVRQAAPFQAFNIEMRKSYDRLEFTRWWQFSKRRSRLAS
ncbi:MAG: TonB family protein [Pseudomonadales bacterium]|nr:TonB family protein [Pseudomonadales bacterium]